MRYRWFVDDEEEQLDDMGRPLSRAAHDEALHPQEKKGFTRGERASIVLATLIILYGLGTADVPLVIFCAAYLLFILRPLARKVFKENGEFVSNAMKGCSIALFIGAFLMTLML